MFSASQRFLNTLVVLKTVQPIPVLALSLCLISGLSTAEEASQQESTTTVYKNVGPDGSVTFSDQPAPQSEILQIAPVPTVPALKPEQIAETKNTRQPPQTDATAYDTFNILSPADQSAFNSGSGDVSVLLEISPALSSGHQIELRMDQKLIDRGNELQVSIPNVDRGTHHLQARIISSSGQVIKEANASFTMHRPSIRR